MFETMNCGNKKICSFVGLQLELDAIFAEGEEEGESFLGKRSARLEDGGRLDCSEKGLQPRAGGIFGRIFGKILQSRARKKRGTMV